MAKDILPADAVQKQSEQAYKQWAEKWRAHAKHHSKYAMKPWEEFMGSGVGKAIVLAANGYSLELEMETLKSHQGNVDILCCDKSLGHLLKNGIRPTYCLVADASVNYEKYLKPYEDQLQDTILFMNVCGNPEWSDNGNWKDRYFFVNMDVLKSEREFMQISGCTNAMPAGTNVSNAMIVLMTQSNNEVGRQNFFGYDKILLIGFDYAWRLDGNYYAYSKDGDGKGCYMRHIYTRNAAGQLCCTSTNLAFSAMWAAKYVGAFKLPIVQCSKESIFLTPYRGVLAEQMQYNHKREDADKIRSHMREMNEFQIKFVAAQNKLKDIAFDHYRSLQATT